MTATTIPTRITARDLMSREVAAVDPEMSLTELATFLEDRGISGALVRERDGRPVGVVSVSDVSSAGTLAGRTPDTAASRAGVYAQTWEAKFDDSDIEPIRIEESELTVGDVMTPEVVAVAADAPVAEIARTMLDQHIHRVFVREGDAVVGLVSTTDLLGLLAGPDQE
jgi:CBS domain-containing protein